MPRTHQIYLEVGPKRVFAAALDWPGWCRAARDEDAAVEALFTYGPRYRAALGQAASGFTAPVNAAALEVVDRLKGNATTDFGAPAVAPPSDERPLKDAELARLVALLKACWRTFDRTAKGATGAVLQKGPRGGGREVAAIVDHVRDADGAYLSRLGGRYKAEGAASEMAGVRRALVEALSARAHGDPLPPSRRTSKVWTPRYGIRRSAWHALDHAWEIEDRTQ
jgi:hypothetical protein